MTSLGMFLHSDFQGDIVVRCDYCGHRIHKTEQGNVNKEALELHVIFAHLPPSEVSREIRRNMELGHV